jgi:tetratricopeptide (TPR) repeat protein
MLQSWHNYKWKEKGASEMVDSEKGARIAARTVIQPQALIGESNPGFSEAKEYFVEAYNYHQLKQFSKALELYRQASVACPKMYESHYNSGLCYEQLGKLNDAVAEFEEAAARNPLYRLVFLHLVELYEKLGDKQRADTNRAAYSML